MDKVNSLNELISIVKQCSIIVSYCPLSDEVNPDHLPFVDGKFSGSLMRVPLDPSHLPEKYAGELIKICGPKRVCLLVPGRAFDLSGSRQGRGGGWYDRLLASLPAQWLRIGVAKAKSISFTPLEKKSWDEPVDWLIWNKDGVWQTRRTNAHSN